MEHTTTICLDILNILSFKSSKYAKVVSNSIATATRIQIFKWLITQKHAFFHIENFSHTHTLTLRSAADESNVFYVIYLNLNTEILANVMIRFK